MAATTVATHRPRGDTPGGTTCPNGQTHGPGTAGMAASTLAVVICEVDESLRALLAAAVPSGTDVQTTLTTVHEDVTGLPANWSDIRDERGTVIARRPPIHRYELRYTVTVQTTSTDAEHALLDAVLTAISGTNQIQPPHLHEQFVGCGLPVLIRLDSWRPELTPRPLGLDLVITAPLLTTWIDEVAPVPAEFHLDAAGGRPPAPTPVRPPHPLRSRRIRENT